MAEDPRFVPFYDRLANLCPIPLIGKLIVAVGLGLLFIVVHNCWPIDDKIVMDWSLFLGLLITIAMLCLYFATHVLRAMFPEMDRRLSADDKEVYLVPLHDYLSDRYFIVVGIFFGVVNCCFGYAFGNPYAEPETNNKNTIYFGFFLAGFICGMAAYSIIIVTVSINAFARKAKSSLDFTSPDRCGGTLFVGNACIVFAIVTLITGVMISIYILKTNWSRRIAPQQCEKVVVDNTTNKTPTTKLGRITSPQKTINPSRKNTQDEKVIQEKKKGTSENTPSWVIVMMGLWIVFPYSMSLITLFGPAIEINKILREYKASKDIELQQNLVKLKINLGEENGFDAEKQTAQPERIKDLIQSRQELHKMNTWPYSTTANLTYTAVVVPNLFATTKTALDWAKILSSQS